MTNDRRRPLKARPLVRHAGTVLGSTFVIWFFSEMYFLNVGDGFYVWSNFDTPADVVIHFADLIFIVSLFYGLSALWLLIPIHLFRVRSPLALFLAGSLCGWAIEGILPIMYAEMPLALLWPAASWHVVVDVFLGWWLLRRLLERNNHLLTGVVFTVLGLFWGLWATWFWPDDGVGSQAAADAPLTSAEFAFIAFQSTAFLIVGYLLLDRVGGNSFKPGKMAIRLWAVVSALAVIALSLVFAPIFFALTGATMLVLRRNARTETREPIFATFKPGITTGNAALILLMPVSATATYPYYLGNGITVGPIIWLLLLPLVAASAVAIVVAVTVILRQPRPVTR